MGMPLGCINLRKGEFFSIEFPGFIDKGDGRFRKQWIRPGGKTANAYFVIAVCSWCGNRHLQWERNKKKNKTGTTFCSPTCQSLGRFKIGNEKNKRGSNVMKSHKLTCVPSHPYARKGYVPSHRLIVEKRIGRYLTPDEVIHHINCIPYDNNSDNLVLCETKSEHNRIHTSLLDCVDELLKNKSLIFDYEKKIYKIG